MIDRYWRLIAWVAAFAAFVGTLACDVPDSVTPVRTPVSDRSAPAPVDGDSTFAAGYEVYFASPDTARAIWLVALRKAEQGSDSAAQSRLHRWIGLASNRLGEPVEAKQRLARAFEIATAMNDSAESGRVHHALSVVAYSEDRLRDVITHAEIALRLADATSDEETAAKASGLLGLVLGDFGEVERAQTLMHRQRQYGAESGQRRLEADALANLARLALWSGDPRGAMTSLESILPLYRSDRNRVGEVNALGQLATAHVALGEPGSALARLDSALVLARAAGLEYEEVELLRLVAGVYATASDVPNALAKYEQATALAMTRGLVLEAAASKRQIAALHLMLGNLDLARHALEHARATHRASGEIFQEFDDVLMLIQVETQHNNWNGADAALRDARRLADAIDVPSAHRGLALAAAGVADARNDWRGVLKHVRIAAGHLLPGDYTSAAEVHVHTARAHHRAGRRNQAITEWYRAVDAIERIRGALTYEPWRRSLAADRSPVYASLVAELLAAGRDADAFSAADRARSRGLAERVMSGVRQQPSVSTAIARRREGVKLLELDALLDVAEAREREGFSERGGRTDTASVEIRRKLSAARDAFEAEYVLSSTRGDPRSTVLGTSTVSLREVQQVLRAEEGLLLYLINAANVVLFVVRKESSQTLILEGSPEAIEGQARVMRGTWGRPDSGWRSALMPSQSLHEALIEPALESGLLDGVKQLVIVPHGVLAQIPFPALQARRSSRFLVQDFSTLLLPSASALVALRRNTPSAGAIDRPIVFAPFPTELPSTRHEARAFGRTVRRSTVSQGANAGERAVRQALQRGSLVHIASHATLIPHNPLFSRVELAALRPASNADDNGRLEVHELLALRIRSPLVFLSGCETGLSSQWLRDPVIGVDHLNLMQAFLYAGAQNVAGTLWRINDVGAAALASEFYKVLPSRSPAGALAAAQRAMIESKLYANPYYWAGYVIAGSDTLDTR